MIDLTTAALYAGYALLVLTVIASIRAALRHRDARRLDILGVVSSLLAIQILQRAPTSWVRLLGVMLLLAQPYFLLRLVAHFRAVPALLSAAAVTFVAIVAAALLAKPALALTSGIRIGVPLAIAIAQIACALAFSAEVRRTAGVTAHRLLYAAAGTWMFAMSLLFVGLGQVSATIAAAGVRPVYWIETAMLICYFVAFNTPRWLKARWQQLEQARFLSATADRDPEERGRQAAADLNRAAARSIGHAVTLVALRDLSGGPLLVTAASDAALLGQSVTPATGVLGRALEFRKAVSGGPDDCEPELADRLRGRGARLLAAPLATSTHTWGVVLAVLRHGSLFPEDDLQLLGHLGRYAATALDHAHLVAEARERERLIADRRLREAEARMSLMLDAIKDYAMCVLDPGGRVAAWYIGAEHLFQHRSAEMLGEPAAPLFAITDAELAALLSESRRFGLARREGPCARRDGSRFIGVTTIRPLEGDAGQALGFAIVTRDVTDRRAMEERLRQSQKMEAVGQLAGGIAHDFNNLLQAILGNAHYLRLALKSDQARLEEVREIEKAADRAAALTRQLMAFSQQRMIEAVAVNLSRLVADLMPMLRRLIPERIEIAFEASPDETIVRGDHSQLEQIALNLAVNARDAMPSVGRLTIRTALQWLDEPGAAREVEPGSYAFLEVSDTGVGMDAAIQGRIFEPFFTTKQLGGGTGLGLATVYGIVKQMGGMIRVESEPGKGSTFRLYFPQSLSVPAAAASATLVEAGHGHETILLVEDDDGVRAFLTQALERNGYRVVSADRMSTALSQATAHRDALDLLIADVVLPGGTGPELAKAIEAIRPGLPVLYISGYADAVLARQATVPKASQFLQKPFSADDLLRRIRQVLGGS